MTVTLEQAIDKLRKTEDWGSDPDTRWTSADVRAYRQETGLQLNTQLQVVLEKFGLTGFDEPEEHAYFLAHHDHGSTSIHEVQFLTYNFQHMVSSYHAFSSDREIGYSRLPATLNFFGTADGGNNHLLTDGTNPENNAVYFWKRVDEPWGEGDNTKGLAKVADTLYEFFYNLRPYEEL